MWTFTISLLDYNIVGVLPNLNEETEYAANVSRQAIFVETTSLLHSLKLTLSFSLRVPPFRTFPSRFRLIISESQTQLHPPNMAASFSSSVFATSPLKSTTTFKNPPPSSSFSQFPLLRYNYDPLKTRSSLPRFVILIQFFHLLCEL